MFRPLKCLDCPESEVYSSENELEAHIAAEHIKLLPYGCGMCTYGKFPTEYALVKHYAEIHEITSNITLNVCYSTKLPLRRKELEEKLKMCKEARDSPGSTTPELEVTMSNTSDETACGPVKCLDCTEVYHSKEMLVAHIAQEHLQSMPYKCEICKHAMFPTEYVLACHFKEDHKRTGAINLIMIYSPEIIMERRELARKTTMCLESSSRRSIDPVPINRTPAISVRINSPANTPPTPLEPVRKIFSFGKLPSTSAVPRSQPQASGTSTTVPTKITSTAGNVQSTPIISPVTSYTRRKSSRVSKKKVYADFVVEPATPEKLENTAGSSTTPGDLDMSGTESNGISDASNTSIHPDLDLVRNEPPPSSPPAKKQCPVKREAKGGTSEHAAKRVPVKPMLKTPLCLFPAESEVKTELPEPITRPSVQAESAEAVKTGDPSSQGQQAKIEEPDDLLEIKKEANAESPCKVVRPVPYSLKIEEWESILEEQEDQNDQEYQMEQEEEDNGSEEGSEGSESSKESVKCTLCPKILTKKGSQRYHACLHGDLALFECGYCGCKFNGDKIYSVKRHLLINHKESDGSVDLNNFKDNRKKLKMKIKKLTEKCFPNK